MKVRVISLDRTPARWAEFRTHNKELSCSRFSAVDGLTIKEPDPALFEPGLRYSPGALGCAASHIALWRTIAQEKVPVIVLEDDAICHRDLELMVHRLGAESLPKDWDYLALGFNMDCPVQLALLPGVTPCLASFLAANVPAGLSKFPALEIRPVAYRLQLCFGTPGYAVTPVGAKKLLDSLLPLKNFTMSSGIGTAENIGIDVALVHAYAAVNAYVSFPPLVITANDRSASTVRGTEKTASAGVT